MGRLMVICSALMLLIGCSFAIGAGPVQAAAAPALAASTESPITRVIVGSDRYETAVLVSRAGFPEGAPAVVIARGDDYVDALCSAPLAYAYGGPLLLTPKSGLPEVVAAEIARLDPTEVFLVGVGDGTSPILSQLKTIVGSNAITTLIGRDRYETAALVADQLMLQTGTPTKVVVAPGDSFADSLSVAPLAAVNHWPILYTPQWGELPEVTLDVIAKTGVDSALEVGTHAQIDLPEVVKKVGVDRYDTCALIAEYALDHGLAVSHVAFATGEKFPDGLAAAPYLALDQGMLLLTKDAVVTPAVEAFLGPRVADVQSLDAVGLRQVPAGPWLSIPTTDEAPPSDTDDTQPSSSTLPRDVGSTRDPAEPQSPSTTTTLAPAPSTTATTVSYRPTGTLDLARALASASAGQTIYIPDGTYNGPFNVNGKRNLTLRGGPGAVIRGSGGQQAIMQFTDCSGLQLEGFTIQGDYSQTEQIALNLRRVSGGVVGLTIRDAGYSGIVAFPATDLVVENCRITHCGDFGVHTKDGSARITVRNCTLSGFASRLYPGHGIYFSNSTDCRAIGNVISDVQRTPRTYEVSGIKYAHSSGYCAGNTISDSVAGISLPGGYNVTVENNLCRRLSERGIYFLAGAHDCVARNNTIDTAPVGFAFADYSSWPTRITVTGNIVKNVSTPISLGRATNCTVTGNSWN